MILDHGGSPEDWIVKDGLPARVLGDPLKEPKTAGLPSSEDEETGFVVYELLLAMWKGGLTNEVRLFPHFYGPMCLLAPGGLVPQHHQPTQQWIYRPAIYRWTMNRLWERQGSQRELEWRVQLHNTFAVTAMAEAPGGTEADVIISFMDRIVAHRRAEEKAMELLCEHLLPTQLAELTFRSSFRVIGGLTGKHYQVEPGNGFAEVHRLSNDPLVNYCLHPEDWMPDGDVALSVKLHLESPELEEETIARANATNRRMTTRTTPRRWRELRYAADQEREFLAAPA